MRAPLPVTQQPACRLRTLRDDDALTRALSLVRIHSTVTVGAYSLLFSARCNSVASPQQDEQYVVATVIIVTVTASLFCCIHVPSFTCRVVYGTISRRIADELLFVRPAIITFHDSLRVCASRRLARNVIRYCLVRTKTTTKNERNDEVEELQRYRTNSLVTGEVSFSVRRSVTDKCND